MSDNAVVAMEPRPYHGPEDFEQLKRLLQAGRGAATGSYYVHTGDVSWWLFYLLPKDDLWQHLYLWEAPGDPALLAWSLVSPAEQAFDLFCRPDLRGSPQARRMLDWTIARARQTIREAGGEQVEIVWVAESDEVLMAWLEANCFSRDQTHLTHFEQRLDRPLPAPVLPPGYRAEAAPGEARLETRAAASYAAFGSRWPFDRYCDRYRRFMHSPVYRPDLDLMVMAPDGRCVAFCILWLDEANQVGLFEPVGVHPDFQGRGLGKALVLEGLSRLKALEMQQAIVSAEGENLAAIRLYQSAGFRVQKRLFTYASKL